jgi:3-oxoacyl-[acyl-carrier protein] reductase
MDLKLSGRTALVTGASAGIGTGIAEALAREGVRLVLAGRRREALEEVARRATSLGAPAATIAVGDVATEVGCRAVTETALGALGGRVDILVNNAGAARPLKGEDTEAFWEEALALNFTPALRIKNPLVGPMKAAGFGRIINVTGAIYSKAVTGAIPSKAALLSWSRALSFEFVRHGITVNCVAPGRFNPAQVLEGLHPTEASRQALHSRQHPGRTLQRAGGIRRDSGVPGLAAGRLRQRRPYPGRRWRREDRRLNVGCHVSLATIRAIGGGSAAADLSANGASLAAGGRLARMRSGARSELPRCRND